MATAAIDNTFKIWDIRQLKGPLQTYKVNATASNLAFSQKGLLAVGMGNVVEVYRYFKNSYWRWCFVHHHLFLIQGIVAHNQQGRRIWSTNSIVQ